MHGVELRIAPELPDRLEDPGADAVGVGRPPHGSQSTPSDPVVEGPHRTAVLEGGSEPGMVDGQCADTEVGQHVRADQPVGGGLRRVLVEGAGPQQPAELRTRASDRPIRTVDGHHLGGEGRTQAGAQGSPQRRPVLGVAGIEPGQRVERGDGDRLRVGVGQGRRGIEPSRCTIPPPSGSPVGSRQSRHPCWARPPANRRGPHRTNPPPRPSAFSSQPAAARVWADNSSCSGWSRVASSRTRNQEVASDVP